MINKINANGVILNTEHQGQGVRVPTSHLDCLNEPWPATDGVKAAAAEGVEATGRVDSGAGIVGLNVCGIPVITFEEMIRESRLQKIEAVKDLPLRAELIVKYRIHGICDKSRELIRSVADASITGRLIQVYLDRPFPVEPVPLKSLVRQIHHQLDVAYPTHRRRRARPASNEHPLVTASMKLTEELCVEASGTLASEIS